MSRIQAQRLALGLTRRQFIAAPAGLYCLASGFAHAQVGSGRSFYVSPDGSDANPGFSHAPFATISGVFAAVGDLGPADTIVVMPGVYNEQVTVTAGGSAAGDLRLVSHVPHAAQIRSPAGTYSAVNVVRSFVTVEGFDVQAGGDGHAIEATFIDGDQRNEGPHHITIRNNICHDSAGSGISLSYGDFYTIEGNACFRNCATNEYQGSGISIYAPRAVEGGPGFRNFVRGNICHENMAIQLPGDVPHSDGNGIIIDDTKNSQSKHPAGSYQFMTLVENNIVYRNGGKGVHVFLSENVLVRNNTCAFNNRDPKNPATWRGELSNVDSNRCIWVNNIGVADTKANRNNAGILDAATRGVNRDVMWIANLTFSGKAGERSVMQAPANPTLGGDARHKNIFGRDPKFVSAAADAAQQDFHLQPGSPAIDAGSREHGLAGRDFGGGPRVQGAAPDLGAFEAPGGTATE